MKTICPGLRKLTLGAVLTWLVLTLAGVTSHAYAENAVDRSANRISKDRWTRTEPGSPKRRVLNQDDDDDDDDTASASSTHSAPASELNGALNIKGW